MEIREWENHKEFNLANFNHRQKIWGNYNGDIDNRLLTNKRKKKRFIIRKVRPDGMIKWDHRFWKPTEQREHLHKLIGRTFAFGTYSPEYSFLYLWGSEEAYYDDNPDDGRCWDKDMKFMTVPDNQYPGQRLCICVWWYPVTDGRDY